MKNRTAVVSAFLAFALAFAPATPAFAAGRHNGGHYGGGGHYSGGGHYGGRGHYGGGPIWGLTNVLVGTAAAIITAPIVILAAATRAPRYYPQGPAYDGPSGEYADPAAPDYQGAPQAAPYYAPEPAYAPAPAYSVPPQAVYYAPRPAYPTPRARYYYAPPPGAYYYSR